MKEYIEKTLHCSVIVKEYQDTKRLPLLLSSSYVLSIVLINGNECVFAEPMESINFSTIRKQWKQLEKLTGKICVLSLNKINAYAKDKMIEEGIPFVVEGKQIYLPFLGLSISKEDDRMLKPCVQLSFLTQKLLLMSIYESWKDITVTSAAQKMMVSKMSVTRCFDEIEALELPYIKTRSRSRLFSADADKKRMWNDMKDVLRNPVIQQFYLKEDIKENELLSGLSALGYYSMLDDNPYPIYAVSKKGIVNLLKAHEQIRTQDDIPGCVIQEVGYTINYADAEAMDPLSVSLMISAKEMNDPRVEKAIDEMLEDEVWSKV